MIFQTVVVGKAGQRESHDYYVGVAERAVTMAEGFDGVLYVSVDHIGQILVGPVEPRRIEWLAMTINRSSNPDCVADAIEHVSIEKGYDEGRRKGRRLKAGSKRRVRR